MIARFAATEDPISETSQSNDAEQIGDVTLTAEE
jgi:hypothetical protein